MELIYILDMIGIFAFSVYGAYVALEKGFDIFGIGVCAFLTALGGGTIRELILNHTPFYLFDYNYMYVIMVGVVFAIAAYYNFTKINRYMLIIDAIGLATFAFIGSQRAIDAGLGIIGTMFFAVLTAVGGGMLRDALVKEIPKNLYMDFYATPTMILGALLYFFREYAQNRYFVYGLILLVFGIRCVAIYMRADLWGPFRKKK